MAAPLSQPPHPIDAVLLEEDTFRSLGSEPGLSLPPEHPVRTLTAAHEVAPAAGGSLLDAGGAPRRLLVVVHDLDREPSWQAEWLEIGLRRGLQRVDELGIAHLGMPILGTVHGRMPWDQALSLTLAAIAAHPGSQPQRIWLMVPAEQLPVTLIALRQAASG